MTPAELRSIHFDLLDHVACHLTELLPQHLTMLATPEQLVLTSSASGPARAVATHSVPAPERLDLSTIRVVAHHVLADAQELVIEHMHEPWPTTSDGRSLYASSSVAGHSVRLGFHLSGSPEERAITLPDFVFPEGASIVRSAG
jgi:hypothetical protein